MNVIFVVVITQPVQMIVVFHGVITALVPMNAAYPMVTTHPVQIVQVRQMALLM